MERNRSNTGRGYAQQTQAMNRMRGMLEDEAADRKAKMMKQMQEENKRIVSNRRPHSRQA